MAINQNILETRSEIFLPTFGERVEDIEAIEAGIDTWRRKVNNLELHFCKKKFAMELWRLPQGTLTCHLKLLFFSFKS